MYAPAGKQEQIIFFYVAGCCEGKESDLQTYIGGEGRAESGEGKEKGVGGGGEG